MKGRRTFYLLGMFFCLLSSFAIKDLPSIFNNITTLYYLVGTPDCTLVHTNWTGNCPGCWNCPGMPPLWPETWLWPAPLSSPGLWSTHSYSQLSLDSLIYNETHSNAPLAISEVFQQSLSRSRSQCARHSDTDGGWLSRNIPTPRPAITAPVAGSNICLFGFHHEIMKQILCNFVSYCVFHQSHINPTDC